MSNNNPKQASATEVLKELRAGAKYVVTVTGMAGTGNYAELEFKHNTVEDVWHKFPDVDSKSDTVIVAELLCPGSIRLIIRATADDSVPDPLPDVYVSVHDTLQENR